MSYVNIFTIKNFDFRRFLGFSIEIQINSGIVFQALARDTGDGLTSKGCMKGFKGCMKGFNLRPPLNYTEYSIQIGEFSISFYLLSINSKLIIIISGKRWRRGRKRRRKKIRRRKERKTQNNCFKGLKQFVKNPL